MSRKSLKASLEGELRRWQAKPYQELMRLKYPIVYETGAEGEPGYYSTEVSVLEKDEGQIHLSICVDDGGLSAFVPVSSSIIVTAQA